MSSSEDGEPNRFGEFKSLGEVAGRILREDREISKVSKRSERAARCDWTFSTVRSNVNPDPGLSCPWAGALCTADPGRPGSLFLDEWAKCAGYEVVAMVKLSLFTVAASSNTD